MFDRNQQLDRDTRMRPTPLQNEALEYVVGGAGSMTSILVLINRRQSIMQSVEPVLEYAGSPQPLNPR